MRGFAAPFSEGQKRSLYDCKRVRHDTDIGGWNHRWSPLRMWCPGFVDPRGMLDLMFWRHAKERSYVRLLLALVHRFGEGAQLDLLDLCCWDRSFDRFYLVQDEERWWRELDFEERQRRSSKSARFLDLHNLEVFALPQRDRDLLHVAVRENSTAYEPL